ncbi:MAG TPA: alpha-amylase family glycosyl hydrolase [Caulobacterales bacterium]|nr:alpha-amylase family glycosyl hydrolase [Caulobacterales bacterium]
MTSRGIRVAACAALSTLLLILTPASPGLAQEAVSASDRGPEDEIVYFVLPDRFENGDTRNDRGLMRGGRLNTGFDPTSKGFFHGGDLAGLTRQLDYIEGLGATAVWVAPIFRNKPVQGRPGDESAGYHGYWVTDFTDVDPHFGTRAEFRAFVDAAHARGLRVYMDIITNHTADVIQYRGCGYQACPYRGLADYPYTRRGGVNGAPINDGFLGDDHADAANFARLTNPNFAYDVYVPAAERRIKHPDWLNDPIYYHNRGNSTFRGESSLYGDFFGLDDLYTEHPRVIQGFIDIYGAWIDQYGVDGFRIDTARHVNPQFWQAFAPAMIARARARGNNHFHIFGEVFDPDPGHLAQHTRVDGLPAVLDFGFQSAAYESIAKGGATESLDTIYRGDSLYEGGARAALQLPTFLGNHDMGRFAFFVLKENPGISDAELFARVRLAHALMLLSRGAPVVYYGDEQGFTGDGGDQDARQDMFATQVASYMDDRIVGSSAPSGSGRHFDCNAPLYRAIAEAAALRRATPALRRGAQVSRAYGEHAGLFAFSRLLDGAEVLVAINTSREPVAANVLVEAQSAHWRSLHGACAGASPAPAVLPVQVPALDYIVCISERS